MGGKEREKKVGAESVNLVPRNHLLTREVLKETRLTSGYRQILHLDLYIQTPKACFVKINDSLDDGRPAARQRNVARHVAVGVGGTGGLGLFYHHVPAHQILMGVVVHVPLFNNGETGRNAFTALEKENFRYISFDALP